MAKYSSDTALIKGAGVAYKDWENVPGMYAGLDKVTAAGEKFLKKTSKKIEKETK